MIKPKGVFSPSWCKFGLENERQTGRNEVWCFEVLRRLVWKKTAEREKGRAGKRGRGREREIEKSIPKLTAAQMVGTRWENDDLQIRSC